MEHTHLLLLIVVGLQIATIYLVLRDTRFYKDVLGRWEKAFEFWRLNEEAEEEYQKQREASLSEYRQCVEKWQAKSARAEKNEQEWERQNEERQAVYRKQEEEYQTGLEEDRQKREKWDDEYERDKQEWNEVLRRLKAFLDRCEQT
jgi:hypothetical protein